MITPERTLEGTYFRSDERMTRYEVSNSKGSFEKEDMENETTTTAADTASQTNDSLPPMPMLRSVPLPRPAQQR